MKLTYTYRIEEKLKHSTTNISDIDIEVEYNPIDGVTEIYDVIAFNKVSGGCVDIGRFLIEVMGLDKTIGIITDWHALYHQELQNKKEIA